VCNIREAREETGSGQAVLRD